LKSFNLKSDLRNNPKVPFVANFCFKEKFENSYKDIPDEKFQEVVDYTNFLKENPS
jgi:hypothetical protein